MDLSFRRFILEAKKQVLKMFIKCNRVGWGDEIVGGITKDRKIGNCSWIRTLEIYEGDELCLICGKKDYFNTWKQEQFEFKVEKS